MAFEAGQRVGDYEVVRVLGTGGLGEVYEVRHAISQRAEAMKVLLPDQRAAAEMGERFRREIQMLGALSHPNIASLHNAFYHDGQLIMVMELVSGETLRAKSTRTLLSVPNVLRYARQILSALDYAHARSVVHRDIKPTNIMITAEDEIKLLDFGIAISDRSSDLTAPGFIVGSISYMSPEQISGDKATVRSDLYAVGVTLYEVFTGRLPVGGTSNFEIMRAHLVDKPEAPNVLNPRLPAALSNAILKALEKKPEDRFASAQDFLAALSAIPAVGMDDIYSLATTQLRIPGSSGQRSQPDISSQPLKSSPQNLPVGDITKKLAVYIGPIASVLVRKLAANCSDLDQLYKEAATHIPSEADRQRFLQSKRS
ncbi:MAG TPA: serine/threonine-protein kinase [Silvibacterium sp.]|jgi:serine/threonine-protein kinase|nr:serine/threonine-protein kinase [Silvibacterium sp.]